jgi:hypothetical protein
MAGPAGHPQQDDAFAIPRRTVTLRRGGSRSQDIGEREPGQSAQPGLEHAATPREDKPFALSRVEALERVSMSMLGLAGSGIHRRVRKAGVQKAGSSAGVSIADDNRFRVRAKRPAGAAMTNVVRGMPARSLRLGVFEYLKFVPFIPRQSSSP